MPGARWSDRVVAGEVDGHPSLMYADRVRSFGAVLQESARWVDREYLIQGERRVTFGDHERATARAAHGLWQAGVRPGDRVGVFAANSPDWVAVFHGALTLGAIVAPFNGWWSSDDVRQACDLVSPAVVVADERRSHKLPAGVRAADFVEITSGCAPTCELPAVTDENNPAMILFTAGTTGYPKGAVLSHRSLIANLQTLLVVSRKLPDQIPDDIAPSVTLVGLPLFHIGAIQLLLVPLMTGSKVVFLEGKFDVGEFLRLVESEHVTMFSGVPTMMERILAHPDLGRHDLSSLRTVVLGGSPVSRELLERIGTALPNTRRRVGQTYGLTEAGGVVSTGVGADIESHHGCSGRLAPVVEARVAGPDAEGNGELLVRSPAAMDGYWGLPDDPTLDSDGWIRTGDIGRVDGDRYLYISGRVKEIIIRGGENVSAAAVEAALARHPAIAEVAVVGLPDPDLGEIVAAAVMLADGQVVEVGELDAWARKNLAHYAVPAKWWIRSALPTNDAGKILKRELIAAWPVGVEV
ncbi:class I adenylate-forming enzyme family protein [Mycobacterium sp. CVI_P3]|uniref:Class I adenylate-forming enzyme family protein n=1 Tax=Mycobacterium pinniadriaticum TaxID=2994102 RepID=A0ABT3SMY2_9MYCO|nr:class I adenylate-forming enzyme family protein [Mycobacterium pinniadriaticum]MCX2933773.1 class I adenylate-forming enzyme family protein [Mycobacterium pinniadriaticum]MCX2940195.1 class I adenylate-forming enzyme family protein [Mycobacterium pinniadriaticum]